MWLFTRHGFYSLTRSKQEPHKLQVRARVRLDLENLQTLTGLTEPILETTDSDYRWRMIVTPVDGEYLVSLLTHDIDYTNFKGVVAKQPDQSAKLTGLHAIWEIHHGWQSDDASIRTMALKSCS